MVTREKRRRHSGQMCVRPRSRPPYAAEVMPSAWLALDWEVPTSSRVRRNTVRMRVCLSGYERMLLPYHRLARMLAGVWREGARRER